MHLFFGDILYPFISVVICIINKFSGYRKSDFWRPDRYTGDNNRLDIPLLDIKFIYATSYGY